MAELLAVFQKTEYVIVAVGDAAVFWYLDGYFMAIVRMLAVGFKLQFAVVAM